MKVLYLSYDGLTDPLGQSQVLPYLVALAGEGHQIAILACEKKGNYRLHHKHTQERCMQFGITWHFLDYPVFRNPIGYFLFFRKYLVKTRELTETYKPGILHCRSYPAGLAATLINKKKRIPWIFDIRGFWIDERLEGNIWNPRNPLIMIMIAWLRRQEKKMFRQSDAVVTLSHQAADYIRHRFLPVLAGKDITVIPCASDFTRFPIKNPLNDQAARQTAGLPEEGRILSYLGSLGTWYMLDEMLLFYKVLREKEQNAIFLFISPDKEDYIRSRALRLGLPQENIYVRSATHQEIPALLSLSDWGIAFIRPGFSKTASSPVKWGEYLACGIPIIVNSGVGDIDRLSGQIPGFLMVRDYTETTFRDAVGHMDQSVFRDHQKIRAAAAPVFDLPNAAAAYRNLYHRLAQKSVLYIASHRPGRAPNQRFRFEQFLPAMEQNGFRAQISYLITEKEDRFIYSPGNWLRKARFLYLSCPRRRWQCLELVSRSDVVIIAREALMTRSLFFERQIRNRTNCLIYDFDDSIWLPNLSKYNRFFSLLKRPSKTAAIIAMADRVTAGNRYLADYALQFNPAVDVIPTTVDTRQYFPAEKLKSGDEPVVIGWTGSLTTIDHFRQLEPVLETLKDRFGDKLAFKLVGSSNYTNKRLDIKELSWSLEEEKNRLASFDIGIMPLPDNAWTRGKCGFKGLLCMATGVPVVMSPVGVNREIIRDGENGFLADDLSVWEEKLSLLINDPGLRKRLGEAGRLTVETSYSTAGWTKEFIRILKSCDHA
ncbi:MAG TPA: glycosyltransferase [Bacteroidales bacterium]|nr:glycosyltransferase [Bacteroidales bacterium]HSA43512.1 glycosyltransferase [Bacteroidales bacterium]